MIKYSAVGLKTEPVQFTSNPNVRFAMHLTPLFPLLK